MAAFLTVFWVWNYIDETQSVSFYERKREKRAWYQLLWDLLPGPHPKSPMLQFSISSNVFSAVNIILEAMWGLVQTCSKSTFGFSKESISERRDSSCFSFIGLSAYEDCNSGNYSDKFIDLARNDFNYCQLCLRRAIIVPCRWIIAQSSGYGVTVESNLMAFFAFRVKIPKLGIFSTSHSTYAWSRTPIPCGTDISEVSHTSWSLFKIEIVAVIQTHSGKVRDTNSEN